MRPKPSTVDTTLPQNPQSPYFEKNKENPQTPWTSSPASAAAPIRRRPCRTTSSWRSSCVSRRNPSTSSAPLSCPSTGAPSSTTPASSAASASSTGGRLPCSASSTLHGLPSSLPPPAPSRSPPLLVAPALPPHWWPLHCHRGRALLLSERSRALLVRDLVTGDERYLPLPPGFEGSWVDNSAVLCAAGHPDHCDCRSCPFLVAFVFSGRVSITSACLYSSETGLWGDIASIVAPPDQSVSRKPMVLLGHTLYCLLDNDLIIEFDFDTYSLDVIGELSYKVANSCITHIIMLAEDGRLGLAGFEKFNLHLWSGIAGIDDDGMITWARHRVVDLEKFLAPEVVEACIIPVCTVGYAEHADAISVEVDSSGVYMIHLKSMQIEKVSEYAIRSGYICPYTSFYAPGINSGGGDDQPELLKRS